MIFAIKSYFSVLVLCSALAIAAATLLPVFANQPSIPARNLPPCNDNGQTVYDSVHHVCWLANANLAAKQKFDVLGINADGSMPYTAAHAWVKALRDYDRGRGWLGHKSWMMPTTTAADRNCTRHNKAGGGGFAYNCTGSALGALYYNVLRVPPRTNVLPIRGSTNGPFRNLQPNIYWSKTVAADPKQGYQSFSFNTGWQGSNTPTNVLYVLPMVKGRLPDVPAPHGDALERSPDGQTIYDPVADVTWVADGNLSASNSFGVPGIGADGAMDWDTANKWIAALKSSKYAGSKEWDLPDIGTCGGYECKASPLAQLYAHLHLKPGETVNDAGASIGGFHDLQPYMYWSCNGDMVPGPCKGELPRGMGWSLSFSNGFQGTDLPANALYVLPYYPAENKAPAPPSPGPIPHKPPSPCPPGLRCPKPI